MGVNLYIYDSAWNEHPEWETFRHAGDSRLLDHLINNERVFLADTFPCEDPDRELFRPAKASEVIAAFAQTIDTNQERWQKLLSIMQDDKWWIYASR